MDKDLIKYIRRIILLQEKSKTIFRQTVDEIVKCEITDIVLIENTLDSLLSFEFEELFIELNMYYYEIDQVSAERYNQIYKEMWG